MWNRRRFLEAVSGLPFLGGIGALCCGSGAATRCGSKRPRRRARLLPGARRPPVHQRLGHLHGHDRVAHAARSHGCDRLRVQALRDARGAPDQSRRADRDARSRRGRHGDVRSRIGADARHGRRPHRHRSAEDGALSRPDGHEERSDHPESRIASATTMPFATAACAWWRSRRAKIWNARSTRRPR